MLSLKQAAEAVGKGKSTLQRAIKAGKLSAQISERGTYRIDPSELARVYPEDFSTESDKRNRSNQPNTSHGNGLAHHETALLRLELEQVKEQILQHRRLNDREIEQANATIEDLRKRLDNADQEKSRLTLMLEHHSNSRHPAKENNGFLRRFIGV